MCFLIAKKFGVSRSVAYRTERGKYLAELVHRLTQETIGCGIEILTVTDTDVYGEYKPYEFVKTEEEFVSKVDKMKD